MTDLVHPAPAPVLLAVTDGRRFPVRRVFCVGRNYAEHAREMGGDTRDPPFFFMKPADALAGDGASIPYPPATGDFHHEVELAVMVGAGGADIPVEAALDHVFGYACGIDLTRRDLQTAAKKAGRPWDMAKGFDASWAVGPVVPASVAGHPATGRISLAVNGALRQNGDLAEMIWPVPAILSALSAQVRLAAGDVILTGTPAGVGPLRPGDRVTAAIEGIGGLAIAIA